MMNASLGRVSSQIRVETGLKEAAAKATSSWEAVDELKCPNPRAKQDLDVPVL